MFIKRDLKNDKNETFEVKKPYILKMLLYFLIMAFFVCVVFIYYRRLYEETRERIINEGRLSAEESAFFIDKRLSASEESLKLAAYTINTKTEDVHQRLSEMTGGFGPDVVIEAVGSVPTYQMAVNEVAFTGRVTCIGYAKSEVSFQTKYFVQKELDIRGSRNAQPSDFRAVIHYLERGNCPVDNLISRVVKPEEASEAMRQWAEQPGKVFRILVDMQ